MAIEFVSITTGAEPRSVTVPSGTDRLMVVVVYCEFQSPLTVTYGATALDVAHNSDEYCQMFYMLDPPVGTDTIEVNNPFGTMDVAVAHYTGVDSFQAGSPTLSGVNAYVTISADEAGALYVCGIAAGSVSSIRSGSTERYNSGTNGFADNIASSSGNNDVGWDTSTFPTTLGAVFLPSAGGSSLTATAAFTAGSATSAATATVTGNKTATAAFQAGVATVAATLTRARTAAAAFVSGVATAATSATVTGNKTLTASFTAGSATTTVSATVTGNKTATASFTAGSASASTSATVAGNKTLTASFTAGSASFSATLIIERGYITRASFQAGSATMSVSASKTGTGRAGSGNQHISPDAKGSSQIEVVELRQNLHPTSTGSQSIEVWTS